MFYAYGFADSYKYQADMELETQQRCVSYFLYKVVPVTDAGLTDYLGISLPAYRPGDPVPAVPAVELLGEGQITEIYWGENEETPVTDTYFKEGDIYPITIEVPAPEGRPYAQGAFSHSHLEGNWDSCYGQPYDDYTGYTIVIGYCARINWVNSVDVSGLPYEVKLGPVEEFSLGTWPDGVAVGRTW